MPGHVRRQSAVSCAKMADLIEIPSRLWTRVGPKKHCIRWGAHWRHLTNTTNLQCAVAMRSFYRIILTICYYCRDIRARMGSYTVVLHVNR